MPTPLVIRLIAFTKIPYRWRLPVSRRGVLARDHYTCQYCGARPGKTLLTVDHVVPRMQGGDKRWENLVTACGPCNRRKGGRRPEEANMRLLSLPIAPRYVALALIETDVRNAAWDKYLAPYSGAVLA